MTRKEQAIDAGIDFTLRTRPMCIGGATFDDVMREMNRNTSFEEGAKWADETMIEKACKWLKDNLSDRIYDRDCYLDTFTELFIEDFRKAMEE